MIKRSSYEVEIEIQQITCNFIWGLSRITNYENGDTPYALSKKSRMKEIFKTYKPEGFTSVNTYLFVENPNELIDFITKV